MLDATSARLLGKDTELKELPKQLAQKLAEYKTQDVSEHAVVAHISAETGVTMTTVQEVQNILSKAGIRKVQHLPRDKKASEVLIF